LVGVYLNHKMEIQALANHKEKYKNKWDRKLPTLKE
jgi:hypothetical protein